MDWTMTLPQVPLPLFGVLLLLLLAALPPPRRVPLGLQRIEPHRLHLYGSIALFGSQSCLTYLAGQPVRIPAPAAYRDQGHMHSMPRHSPRTVHTVLTVASAPFWVGVGSAIAVSAG